MSILVSIFKWVFPDGLKSSQDYKLIAVLLISGVGSYYFSSVYAKDKIKIANEQMTEKVEVKSNEVQAQLTSQHTLVLQALTNIANNQKEIKDNLKIQDGKLWRLSRDVKSIP